MTLRKRYKRYADGGNIPGGIQLLSLLGQTADSVDPGNLYGRQSTATNIVKGVSSGASIGSMFGPVGTGIGAGAGAIYGAINARKQKELENQAIFHESLLRQQQELNRSSAVIGNNPALVTGQPGEEFYATGGFLKNRYYDTVKASGGKLQSLSSNSAEVIGPSHEQGGVDLPAYNSELEGGETLQDDYVFSERLGFAQLHKKLARAIGKIENKPTTPDRVNALKSLNKQVQSLKQLQEQVRQQYNL